MSGKGREHGRPDYVYQDVKLRCAAVVCVYSCWIPCTGPENRIGLWGGAVTPTTVASVPMGSRSREAARRRWVGDIIRDEVSFL